MSSHLAQFHSSLEGHTTYIYINTRHLIFALQAFNWIQSKLERSASNSMRNLKQNFQSLPQGIHPLLNFLYLTLLIRDNRYFQRPQLRQIQGFLSPDNTKTTRSWSHLVHWRWSFQSLTTANISYKLLWNSMLMFSNTVFAVVTAFNSVTLKKNAKTLPLNHLKVIG